MPSAVLSAFLTFTFITAFTPGPNNILALSGSSRYGFRGNFPGLAGIWTGMACVMLLCGLAAYSASALSGAYIAGMRYVGCAYIVWLAWKVASAPPPKDGDGEGKTDFWAGLVLQFVNVKIIIYGLTAFSGFVLPHYSSLAAVVVFALVLTLIGNAGNLSWALVGSALQCFLLRHGKVVNIVMGILLLTSAVGLLS